MILTVKQSVDPEHKFNILNFLILSPTLTKMMSAELTVIKTVCVINTATLRKYFSHI